MGPNPIWLASSEEGIRTQRCQVCCPEGRPWEDAARRPPPAGQGGTHPDACSWTSGLQIPESTGCCWCSGGLWDGAAAAPADAYGLTRLAPARRQLLLAHASYPARPCPHTLLLRRGPTAAHPWGKPRLPLVQEVFPAAARLQAPPQSTRCPRARGGENIPALRTGPQRPRRGLLSTCVPTVQARGVPKGLGEHTPNHPSAELSLLCPPTLIWETDNPGSRQGGSSPSPVTWMSRMTSLRPQFLSNCELRTRSVSLSPFKICIS